MLFQFVCCGYQVIFLKLIQVQSKLIQDEGRLIFSKLIQAMLEGRLVFLKFIQVLVRRQVCYCSATYLPYSQYFLKDLIMHKLSSIHSVFCRIIQIMDNEK